MATETFLPVQPDNVQALSQSKNEPAWLTEFRMEALEQAAQLELPKLEKMRLDRWEIGSYGLYKAPQRIQSFEELPANIREYFQAETAHNVVIQHNSGVVYSHLSEELVAQGVIFTDLETAAQEHGELVREHLMQVVKANENRVTALHAAQWSGGIFVYVPKNVVIEEPLQAFFVTDDAEALFSPHMLIVADTNSSVSYVDTVISEGGAQSKVYSGIAEVVCRPGSKVQFATVHHLGRETTDLSYRRAAVDKDASIQWVIGEMNMGDTMSDTSSILNGHGSSSDAKVICVGTGDQKLNITTRAVHWGRSSHSDMLTRAVMRDESSAIINGITKIEKGATNAHGEQTERVLMLSPAARGDANPILLIDEDEVTAGHAASAGQVDKFQLYYLMSRGISREEATKLIIYGFLEPIVSQIPIPKLEERLGEFVERKLGS